MRTLLIAIVCGYLGYQIGKNGFGDISKFIVQKKTKISDTVEDVSYLKINESGQITFVGDKENELCRRRRFQGKRSMHRR